MDREFIRAMFATAEILGVEISKERVQGYWQVLQQYGTEAIIAALGASVQRSGFFPRPSELISIITGEDTDVESEAMAMWGLLLDGLHTPRAQRMIDADPRVRAGVAAAGGLFVMRTGVDDEPMRFKKLSFCRAFAGTSRMVTRYRLSGDGPLRISESMDTVVAAITAGKELE